MIENSVRAPDLLWRLCKTYGRIIGYPMRKPPDLRHGVAIAPAVASAPAAFRVRAWQILSRGQGLAWIIHE